MDDTEERGRGGNDESTDAEGQLLGRGLPISLSVAEHDIDEYEEPKDKDGAMIPEEGVCAAGPDPKDEIPLASNDPTEKLEDSDPAPQEKSNVVFSPREIPEKCPSCKASPQILRMSSRHNGQKITRTMVSPCNCGNYYGFIDPPL